jgi:hypothetical protein
MTEEERQEKLTILDRCKQLGEKAYDDMYEAHSPQDANRCYRDVKDYFCDAGTLALELGLTDEHEALSKRLQHIKAVFHSQFA